MFRCVQVARAPFLFPDVGVRHRSFLKRFGRGFTRGDGGNSAGRKSKSFEGALIVLHRAGGQGGLLVVLALTVKGVRWIAGSWQLGTKRIDAPLATDNRRQGERHVKVAAAGKESVSIFKPVQFFGPLATLMQVDIPTGRTHQIRVHAAFAGHPLLGDDKYGDHERNAELKLRGLRRIFLHSQSIAFDWPGTGEPFHGSAPLPPDLAEVIDELAVKKRRAAPTSAGKRGRRVTAA